MVFKKDTKNPDITNSLRHFREKRKWQIALRRYILEKNVSEFYAPYFGLDIENFRKWIELQFTEELGWNNFASHWQFDHIVPVGYFDFSKEEDLKMCWNFINLRVEKVHLNKARGNRIDVLAVKPYFETLYKKTGYSMCLKIIKKISEIEVSCIVCKPYLEDFIIERKAHFELISSLSPYELSALNRGKTVSDILLEREIFKKFG